jgi:adenosylcobinamide amidohydrolase
MASSGVAGGGIGSRQWWLNAHVPLAYDRQDPQRHIRQIARVLGLDGAGVGMLTAADVTRWRSGAEDGVRVLVTVGLGVPVRAAAPVERIAAETAHRVGTINVLAVLPVPLTDAALVNAVVTVTEAKTQALVEAGVPGTGTASDSVCIACPDPGFRHGSGAGPRDTPEPFCGPRSSWGARLARAAHAALSCGTADWLDRNG